MRYQISINGDEQMIVYTTDTAVRWIPCDETNPDYQQYLQWVADGNTAEEWLPEESR